MLSATFHRRAYLTLLTLLGCCMVSSIGLSNVVWPLLVANWVLEGWAQGQRGTWRKRWQQARDSRLLQAVALLFAAHLVGLLWTSNLPQGLHVVERMLPWMAVPLVVLTSEPLNGRERTVAATTYMAAVFVVTVIGLVRWLTIPDLPYRQIVHFISHIRFALNCCMVIFLSVGMMAAADGPHRRLKRLVLAALAVWMVAFLLLLRSYTAFAVLIVVSLVMALWHQRHRWLHVGAWVAVVGGMTAYAIVQYHNYYDLSPIASQPIATHTASGNAYTHMQDGFIESGNYVNNYLCPDEYREQWARRSAVPLSQPIPSGYAVENALVRYLNALGLSKDSAGVAALTDEQVAEVEQGIVNPVYTHGIMPKRMMHVLFFEFESYRCYRAVKGFSMLQRFELWENAIRIIRRHPWAGVGTGDLGDAMQESFRETQSPLLGNQLLPHNEYLTLIALLGVPLFVLVAIAFLRALPGLRRQHPVMVAWVVAILVSCLTENTLDSLAGILFSTWFMALRQP